MRHQRFVVLILLFLMSQGGRSAQADKVAYPSAHQQGDAAAPLHNEFVRMQRARWRGLRVNPDVVQGVSTVAAPSPPPAQMSLADVDAILAIPAPDRDGLYAELIAGPAVTQASAHATTGRSSLRGIGVAVGGVLGVWASHNLVVAIQGTANTALDPKVEGPVIPALRGPAVLTTISGGANLYPLHERADRQRG
jgi:hypothetical protein